MEYQNSAKRPNHGGGAVVDHRAARLKCLKTVARNRTTRLTPPAHTLIHCALTNCPIRPGKIFCASNRKLVMWPKAMSDLEQRSSLFQRELFFNLMDQFVVKQHCHATFLRCRVNPISSPVRISEHHCGHHGIELRNGIELPPSCPAELPISFIISSPSLLPSFVTNYFIHH